MRPISHCLNNQLIDLCQQVLQLEELNKKLNHYLPTPLREHCYIGSFNKGSMVIFVEAAWATELRYLLPSLRDQFRIGAKLYQLTSIKISIVEPKMQNTKPSKNLELSTAAKQAIQQAEEICSYQPLKNALKNLAK